MELRPLTPLIGAEVQGFRFSPAEGIPAGLREAFAGHKVLVLRDQAMTTDDFKAFAQAWGPLAQQELPEKTVDGHPDVQVLAHDKEHPPEYEWHTDLSWHPAPPSITLLLARELPPVGGDTMFADMGAAYRDLSSGMKAYLRGLLAVHDRSAWLARRGFSGRAIDDFRRRYAPSEHPVVRVHPDTKEPHLFVNGAFCTHIKGLPKHESRNLLGFLCGLTDVMEYQCRVRWQPGSLVLWDNRALQHYAVSDYMPARRSMERIILAGDPPLAQA